MKSTIIFCAKYLFVFVILGFALGVARIIAKLRSPLDIGGGWVCGIVGALVGYYLMGWIFANYVNQQDAAQ